MKSPAFDPYHEWLAIPKEFRPPTYYQLLGITETETLQKVIETAALRQSAFLRAFQAGEHAEWANKILSEIAEARAVLLDPKRRKEYDAKLQRNAPTSKSLSSPKVEVVPEVTVERIRTKPDSNVRISAPHSKDSYGLSRKSKTSSPTDDVEVVEEVETEILYSPGRRRGNASSIRSKRIDPVLAWSVGGCAVVVVLLSTIFLIRSFNKKDPDVAVIAPPVAERPAEKIAPANPNPDLANKDILKKADKRPEDRKPDQSPEPTLPGPNPKNANESANSNSETNGKSEPTKPKTPNSPKDPDFRISQLNVLKNRVLEIDGESKTFVVQPRDEVENECLIEEAISILRESNSKFHPIALQQLAACAPNHRTAEVIALTQQTTSLHTEALAIDVLVTWDGANIFDKLSSRLETAEGDVKTSLIVAIGKTKDPRAIEPLFEYLKAVETQEAAARAFMQYGSGAEAQILELEAKSEKAKDADLRALLFRILAEIGTEQTLDRTTSLIKARHSKLAPQVRTNISHAHSAIKLRLGLEQSGR